MQPSQSSPSAHGIFRTIPSLSQMHVIGVVAEMMIAFLSGAGFAVSAFPTG
jgi:hypothetical protein